MLRKLPIVAVIGQGSPLRAERAQLARAVGAMVARLGAHLLTGGGYGVMEAAAEGFTEVPARAGVSIGVIPREPGGPLDQPKRDMRGRAYPNAFVEIAIRTPLVSRADDWPSVAVRNHINIFSADAIVALPGNAGTRNELDMAIHYKGEAERSPSERRTVLVGPIEEFTPAHRELFTHAPALPDAERHLRRILSKHGFALAPERDDVRKLAGR